MKKCGVKDCCNEVESNGGRWSARPFALSTMYCRKHLRWLEQYGTVEPPKMAQGTMEFRFWKHVDKRGEDDCWLWTADCSRAGYGSLWNRETNRNVGAHRFSYTLANGEIPKGAFVMHSCDNKKCVNPAHLSLGTAKENTYDAINRGLRPACAIPVKTGEANPKSKLTLEQARYIKAHPEMKHTELARMWGLSPNCIRGVRIGRTWKEA